MSTDRPALSANSRDVIGKKVATLRRDGRLPAVVYGNGVASDNVSVDAREFEALRRHAGANTLIDLSVDGRKSAPVLVHDVQHHPVTRKPLHVDLYVVRMTDELTVEVPLVPDGESVAINDAGGTLMHVTEHVRVKALPDHLPQSIHYAIDSLRTFDDVIRVADLDVPADVTLLTDPNEIVAKVLPPRVEEAAPAAAEGEEGAAAEGGEGEAAAGGESEGSGSES